MRTTQRPPQEVFWPAIATLSNILVRHTRVAVVHSRIDHSSDGAIAPHRGGRHWSETDTRLKPHLLQLRVRACGRLWSILCLECTVNSGWVHQVRYASVAVFGTRVHHHNLGTLEAQFVSHPDRGSILFHTKSIRATTSPPTTRGHISLHQLSPVGRHKCKCVSNFHHVLGPDAVMARISFRRYTAHILLSLLTVYIFDFFAQMTPHPNILIWGHAPSIGMLIQLATQLADALGQPGVLASKPYCIVTTLLLLYLHEGATAIGRFTTEQDSNFSRTHHNVIHLALAFLVLSELEFYRQYIFFRGFADFSTSLQRFLWANIDPSFKVSRNPFGYILIFPSSMVDIETNDLFATVFNKSHGIYLFAAMLFYVVSGYLNSLIKLVVNPSLDAENISVLMSSVNILYNATNTGTAFLGLQMLRVVRQTNFVAIWGVIRDYECALEWWYGRIKSSHGGQVLPLHSHHTNHQAQADVANSPQSSHVLHDL
jgi:hypothetical protein